MQIEYVDSPWKYAVVDDFLPEPIVRQLLEYSRELGWETPSPRTRMHNLRAEPLLYGRIRRIYDFWEAQLFDELNIHARPAETLDVEINLVSREPGHFYPVHPDVRRKLFSIVVYLAPETCDGTPIYRTADEFVREVEWRPNRALAFVPCHIPGKETFHAVKNTTDQNRIVLALNAITRVPVGTPPDE